MAKNIIVTNEQIIKALSEDDKKITVNVPTKNITTAPNDLSKAVSNATANGLDRSKTNFNVDLEENNIYSKKEILEMRLRNLNENSITLTKKDFLKK